jgi:predicted dehydrogenase
VARDFPEQTVPADLDWDLFCGPTPLRDYNRQLWVKDAFEFGYLTWRGWDLFRDYSGHLMTNWGAHSVDMVQFALGKDATGPAQLEIHPDQIDTFVDDAWHHKTPPLGAVRDRQRDRMRFCPVSATYHDGTVLRFRPGIRQTIFHGEKGSLTVRRNGYRANPVSLLPPPTLQEKSEWDGDGHVARPHLANWVNAIMSGEPLNAPVEVGHRSITVCHLANLARQLGRGFSWDPRQERADDAAANSMLTRSRRAGFAFPET